MNGCLVLVLYGCLVLVLYGCLVIVLCGCLVIVLYGCLLIVLYGCLVLSVVWLVLFSPSLPDPRAGRIPSHSRGKRNNVAMMYEVGMWFIV